MKRSFLHCVRTMACLASVSSCAIIVGSAVAQDLNRLPKTAFAGERKEVALRLAAVERMLDVNFDPSALAAAVGAYHSGGRANPLAIYAPLHLFKTSQQKWGEAIEDYQRTIYDDGDSLVPAAPAGAMDTAATCITAREFCHRRIASVPPSSLAEYQSRVKLLADKLFRAGKENNDTDALRRLARDFFCSHVTDQSLDLLGDLAFERGDFAEALGWWRKLTLPASESRSSENVLLYPSPHVDLVRVRAKQILAMAFQGERERARRELQALRLLALDARGKLAGEEGVYVAIVARLIERLPIEPVRSWPTFGGDETRNVVAPHAPSSRLWADGPTWRVRLGDEVEPVPITSGRVIVADNRHVPIHPVIVGDRVLFADARRVFALDLRTGQVLGRYELKEAGADDVPLPRNVRPNADLSRHFTLTVSGDSIYARLETAKATPGKNRGAATSHLVCLEMPLPGRPAQAILRERWHLKPRTENGSEAQFESAPLVHDGRLHVAVRYLQGARTKTYIACYRAETGMLLWQQEACETVEAARGTSQPSEHLLTLAGEYVIFCTHSGAILAVDRVTGKLAWGVRYDSRGTMTADGAPSPRQLCPIVFGESRLYVVPSDSNRIYCLDPGTGRVLWDRDGIEVVELLGVTHGRLIFTTSGGLRALNAIDGTDESGWKQPGVGRLPGLGRGFLAGDWVFWPTRDPAQPLRVVTQVHGTQDPLDATESPGFDPIQVRFVPSGNMVYANGSLVVASPAELTAFIPAEAFLEQRRRAADARPSASAVFRLAQAEASAGLLHDSVKHFDQAASSADADAPVCIKARASEHAVLLEMARRSLKARDEKQMTGNLKTAANGKFSVPLRVTALAQLAAAYEMLGDPGQAVIQWQTILKDKQLREAFLLDEARLPQSAAARAEKRISELIAKHGGGIYAVHERAARVQLDNGDDDSDKLVALVREFPNAQATTDVMRRLAELYERRGEFAAAAAGYRLLIPRLQGEPLTAAQIALARVYEKERCFAAARALWQELAHVPAVRAVAVTELSKPKYHSLDRPFPSVRVPVEPPQQITVDTFLRVEQGSLAPHDIPVLFCLDRETLKCVDAVSGESRWHRKLDFAPTWLGWQADIIVVAGPWKLQAIRFADGEPLWTNTWPDRSFAREFSQFKIAGRHVVFLVDRRQLVALDLDSGHTAWSHWVSGGPIRPIEGGGEFLPRYLVNDRLTVLQDSAGMEYWFHTPTGKRLNTQGTTGRAWGQPPVAVKGDRLCLANADHTVLVNANTQQPIWTFIPFGSTSLSNEPIQIFARDDVILAVVPRNHTCELQRLDFQSGKILWTVDNFRLINGRLDSGDIDCDGQAVYIAAGENLLCRSVESGKVLWRKPIKEPGHWRVVCRGDTLLVHSRPDWEHACEWLPLGPFLLAVPALQPRLSGGTAEAMIFDKRNGALLQSLAFAGSRAGTKVEVFPWGMAMGEGRRVAVWLFDRRKEAPRNGT
jgi:outer membrane protein assembly factor BamB